jgi:hypothetical protein
MVIGAVSAVTERTFATLELNDQKFGQQVEPFTHYGVLRTKKEFAKESCIGYDFYFSQQSAWNRKFDHLLSIKHILSALMDFIP